MDRSSGPLNPSLTLNPSLSPGGAGRRWSRRPAAIGLIVAATLLAGVLALSLLASHQPASTRGTVPSGAAGPQAAGRMMSKASSLVAALERRGEWGSVFTDQEVNAWLAIDLPRLAPGLLPRSLREPTVRFRPRGVALSAQLVWGPCSGRLWSVLTVNLRSDNLLEVGVEKARLGALPLPPGVVLETVARQAASTGMGTEMRVIGGKPLLLLTLPGKTKQGRAAASGPEYHLEGLRVDEGELVLAGSTRLPKEGPR